MRRDPNALEVGATGGTAPQPGRPLLIVAELDFRKWNDVG